MGGALRRPRIRREKRKKFYCGVYLQLRSNLFYQKFVTKTIARPAKRGGAGTKQKNRLAGKKFPPLKPLHFLPTCRKFLSCEKCIFDFATVQ